MRTIQVIHAPDDVRFPHVAQVFLIERKVTRKGRTAYQAVLDEKMPLREQTQEGVADGGSLAADHTLNVPRELIEMDPEIAEAHLR